MAEFPTTLCPLHTGELALGFEPIALWPYTPPILSRAIPLRHGASPLSSLSFSTFWRASLCSLVPLQFTQFSPFVARSRICTSWDYDNMHVYLMCEIPFCYGDISQAEFMYPFLSLLFHFGRVSIWYLLWPTGILAGDICFSNLWIWWWLFRCFVEFRLCSCVLVDSSILSFYLLSCPFGLLWWCYYWR